MLRILGWKLRYDGISIGRGVHVGPGVTLLAVSGGTLRIGDGAMIRSHARLEVEKGILELGSNVFIGVGTVVIAHDHVLIGADSLIADYVTVRDANHRIERSDTPYRLQGLVARPIHIGSNVWIGAHAAILAGASIGSNSVVGANSVVTGTLDSDSVYAGVPAKRIRSLA